MAGKAGAEQGAQHEAAGSTRRAPLLQRACRARPTARLYRHRSSAGGAAAPAQFSGSARQARQSLTGAHRRRPCRPRQRGNRRRHPNAAPPGGHRLGERDRISEDALGRPVRAQGRCAERHQRLSRPAWRAILRRERADCGAGDPADRRGPAPAVWRDSQHAGVPDARHRVPSGDHRGDAALYRRRDSRRPEGRGRSGRHRPGQAGGRAGSLPRQSGARLFRPEGREFS